jgi:hypothetical protein
MNFNEFECGKEVQVVEDLLYFDEALGSCVIPKGIRLIVEAIEPYSHTIHFSEKQSGIRFSVDMTAMPNSLPSGKIMVDSFHPIC